MGGGLILFLFLGASSPAQNNLRESNAVLEETAVKFMSTLTVEIQSCNIRDKSTVSTLPLERGIKRRQGDRRGTESNVQDYRLASGKVAKRM